MGKSARQRKEKAGDHNIKLAQPDRSGPSQDTLLKFAKDRNLFEEADNDPRNKNRPVKKADDDDSDDDDDESEDGKEDPLISPGAERVMETILWTVSLAMVHFTFDFLVHHQYGMDVDISGVVIRTFQAFLLFMLLFYVLHPHYANPTLLPGLPAQYQQPLRELIFFVMSIVSGCYVIYITNEYGYLAVLKRTPTLGCLWVWSVIELPLGPAAGSLLISLAFFYLGGFTVR